jgi:hypothetical protein
VRNHVKAIVKDKLSKVPNVTAYRVVFLWASEAE